MIKTLTTESELGLYGLSARSLNCLEQEGVNTKDKLASFIMDKGEVELRKTPNLGKVSFNEIIAFIGPYIKEVALNKKIDESISFIENNGFIVTKG
tara:strand:+ start:1063 stop:1350 length:288 start_codon:yes stop_codon:yes gene_type:complete